MIAIKTLGTFKFYKTLFVILADRYKKFLSAIFYAFINRE